MAAQELVHIGRYEIKRVLGKGAMGIVYEGLDPKLNRQVAIKTILLDQLDEATARDYSVRFVREAQAVARLNHPNIVQVFDFGEEDAVAFIVMEFIKGKELKNFFDENHKFAIADVVRVMCELLSALEMAHENRIIHRDIKPANVMMDAQGRAKLTDFGIARVSDVDSTHVDRTAVGTVVGTPSYMSPEQITGEHVDHRTDLFSAGIVLYQFLTGEKPFTGQGAWTIAKKIMSEDPRKPSEINVAVPKEFDNVIWRALAKTPEKRYSDAREFSDALKRVLAGGPADIAVRAAPAAFIDPDATVMAPMEDPLAAPPRPASKPHNQSGTQPSMRAAPEAKVTNDAELEFWRAIKDSDDAEDFELYVEQFPTGLYADLARRKVRKLQKAAGTGGLAGDGSSTQIRVAREAQQLQEANARQEAEAKAKLEADAQARRETEERARQSEQARAKQEAEARARREAEELARQEAEAKSLREAQELARKEAEAKAKREADEKAHLEAQAKALREAQEAARQEAELKARREAETKADAKARRETEEKSRLEAEAKARREAQENARLEAEAKAKREADEKARLEAEAKAAREAQEKARLEAEAKARREADEKARLEAEAKATREAQEKARLEAEAKAKREADEKVRLEAEAKSKREADEKARLEAQARAKREAEEKARLEAEAKAKREAEEKARLEALAKAKREAEEKARIEAEAKAKAKREADEKVRQEAEAKAKRDAEEKARKEAEAKAKRDAEEKARLEEQAKVKAKREADEKARKAAQAAGQAQPSVARAEAPEFDEPQVAAPAKKNAMLVPAIIAALAVLGGGGYMMFGRTSAPSPQVAQVPATAPQAATAPTPTPPVPVPATKVEVAKADPDAGQAAAKREADEKAKREADERAKKDLADKAKGDAEAKRLADEKVKKDAADKAKGDAADKAKGDAETKRLADEKAKKDAADKAKGDSDAKRLADEKSKKDADEKRLADEKTKRDADALAKQQADATAKQQADAAAKQQADAAAKQREADAARQREAQAKREADEKAKREADVKVAAAAPVAPKVEPPKPTADAGSLMEQAQSAEKGGRVGEAVRFYKQATAAGSGAAAKRLGDIYGKGAGDVSRDYQESLRFYEIARSRGVDVPRVAPR